MKKLLPNLSNMKVLLIVLVSLSIGVTLNAQNWIIYDGNVTPDGTTPAWTSGDVGTPPASYNVTDESGNKVLFETTSAGADKQSFKLNKGQATNATWMFRTKAGNKDASMEFEINSKNGTDLTRCYFRLINYTKGGYLKTNYLSTNVTYPSDSTLTVKNYHTYRITVENGSSYKVYLDENLTPILTGTGSTGSTQKQFLRFGDVGSNYTEGYIDWMAYDTTAAYAPGSGNLPSGVIIEGGSTPAVAAAPVAAAGSDLTQTSFIANWNKVSNASSYYIDVATDNAFANLVTGYNNKYVVNSNSLSITGLSVGTSYYYRVRAYNSTGTSANSNVINATTTAAASTDATLTALSVANNTLSPVFASGTTAYTVVLPYGTTLGNLPSVTYTTAANATASKTDASALPGTTTIHVTAQDVIATKDYTINFSVALQSQTIAFTLPSDKVYGNAAFAIPDITSGGSGNPVEFTSSNTAVATISGSTITIVGAGTTTIKANQAGNNSYSAATEVSHDLVIGKATATITINGTKPTYDGTAKSVTTITNPAGKTVNVTYAGSSTAPANAGTYAVVATVNDNNYTGSASADLIIGKAELTVTTEAATRMKGLANPAFVLKYTGFVNGETKAVLTTEPTAACTADASSPVGNYDVTVSGGSAANYSFTYVKGTLAVTVNTGTTSLTGGVVTTYPNPVVAGKLSVEVPSFDSRSSISVSSAGGAIVMTKKLESTITELNLSSVAPGLYIVRIETPAGVIVKQVVKQ